MSWKGRVDMDGFYAAAALLPFALRKSALMMSEADKDACEELRLRRGCVPAFSDGAGERPIPGAGPVTGETVAAVLEAATQASLHAAVNALRRGYVTAPGGVRVGVCGTGTPEGLRSFSSLSLRIPKEIRGCADGVYPALFDGGVFRSTLILSPPGAGKTTLLRELVRLLSGDGMRVSLADERGEVADAESGESRFDVGRCTDVMTGVAKAQAVMMLLRAMNPQVVAVDEVTEPADARALLSAAGCGAALLATVHGAALEEVAKRPSMRGLLEAGEFSRCVTIENRRGVRICRVNAL